MITILRATGACGFWIANGVVGALALTGGDSCHWTSPALVRETDA